MEVQIKLKGVALTVFCEVSPAERGSANSPPVPADVEFHGVYVESGEDIQPLILGAVRTALKGKVLDAAKQSMVESVAERAMDTAE